MSDYFRAGDRIPYDGGVTIRENSVPYKDLIVVNETFQDLPANIQAQLYRLHLSSYAESWVKKLICDVAALKFQEGIERGIERVVDDPQAYFAKEPFL